MPERCTGCVKLAGKVLELEKHVSFLQGCLHSLEADKEAKEEWRQSNLPSTSKESRSRTSDIPHSPKQERREREHSTVPSSKKPVGEERPKKRAAETCPERPTKRANKAAYDLSTRPVGPRLSLPVPSIEDRGVVTYRKFAIGCPAENEWTIEVGNSERQSLSVTFIPEYEAEKQAYYQAFYCASSLESDENYFARHLTGRIGNSIRYNNSLQKMKGTLVVRDTCSFAIKARPLDHRNKSCSHRLGPIVAMVHSKSLIKHANIMSPSYTRADTIQVYTSERRTFGRTEIVLGFKRDHRDNSLTLRLIEFFVAPPTA